MTTSNRCFEHWKTSIKKSFPPLAKYLDKVDRVMTQVDRITEDIAHMPVATFIFRDKESDEVHYSSNIRYVPWIWNEVNKDMFFKSKGPHVSFSGKKNLYRYLVPVFNVNMQGIRSTYPWLVF